MVFELRLTDELRVILRKPLGIVISDEAPFSIKKVYRLIVDLDSPMLCTVGDAVTENF